MISPELPEIIGMSDRVMVMREGLMEGIFERASLDAEVLVRAATGKHGVAKQLPQAARTPASCHHRYSGGAVSQAALRGFASAHNLANIFNDTSILIIVALGQMAVILTKSIDLSVAANLAFTGMAVAMLNATYPGLPLVFLIVLAIGTARSGRHQWHPGLEVNIPAIVVTLGTLTIYRGMAFVLPAGAWVNAHQMTAPFLNTPRTPFLACRCLADGDPGSWRLPTFC